MELNTPAAPTRHSSAHRSRRTLSRGQVFTIDSVIALLFAVTFITVIASAARHGPPSFPAFLAVANYAEDTLTALDATGTLASSAGQSDSAAASAVQLVLNRTLASGLSSSVSVKFYQYVPSGSCPLACQLDGTSPVNEFCRCRTFTTSAGNSTELNASSTGRSTRVFVVNASGSEYFGLATLDAWAP